VSIRSRIFTVIGVVVTAALVETLVIVNLDKARAVTNADLDEALQQFTGLSTLTRLVVELENAQRGYAVSGTPSYRIDYDRLMAVYDRTITTLPPSLVNTRSHKLVLELDRLVRDWHQSASLPVFELRDRSGDVVSALRDLGEPRRQRIEVVIDQIGTTALNHLTDQRNRSNRQLVVVTLSTLAIPAVAIVMLLVLVAVLARIVLDPLAAVAESARQISSGNFEVTLPRDSRDEIGALVRAFRDMTSAVQRRQRDLTDALHREREISQMYGTLRAKAEEEHGRLLATISTVPAALIILEAETGRIVLQNKAADA
jgi:CHASE3 domain sensor protein